jgi:Tol biopolymer transport system component
MPAATPASIRDLLSARGAPSRLFFVSDGVVWSVSSAGEATRVFEPASDTEVLAVDPSPSGEEAAVLVGARGAGNELEVVIVDEAGGVVARFDHLGAGLATPVDGPRGARAAIDWSPQGDQVLVSPRGGAIVAVPLDGSDEPRWFDSESGETTIVAPAWSPTGAEIAYIASSDEERRRTLRVIEADEGSVADVVAPPDERVVVEFAWMPDGAALLFTEGGSGGAVSGIDLWRIDAVGDNRELVASAGSVAPVAQITRVRPSPDGRAVAYAVLVPGPAGPQVDSVWVRDITSRVGFRVNLPSVAAVDDVWWTDQGLVVQVTTRPTPQRPNATQALLQVAPDGTVSALWAAQTARGTPAAATPVATPVGR